MCARPCRSADERGGRRAAARVAELKNGQRSTTTRQSLADRARIILLGAKGLSAAAIEEKIGVARITVFEWRERSSEEVLGALGDRPRPGLNPKDAKRILTMTTTPLPKESNSTQSTPEMKAYLATSPRFVLHFAPASASQLHAVDGWFSSFGCRSIHRASSRAWRNFASRFEGTSRRTTPTPQSRSVGPSARGRSGVGSSCESVERSCETINQDPNTVPPRRTSCSRMAESPYAGRVKQSREQTKAIMSRTNTLFNQLFDLLSTLPKNVAPTNYRFFVLINFTCLAGMLVHGGYFVTLFFALGAKELAFFNIGSALWFALCLALNRTGWILVTFTMSFLEVIAHAWMATHSFGWASGFNYYLFIYALVIFLSPLQMPSKLLLAASNAAAYLSLYRYSQTSVPVHSTLPWQLNLLNTGNVVTVLVIISVLMYYFNLATVTAEAALEKEYQRSESLLLNILPADIAGQLKTTKDVIVDRHPSVTVLFSDVVGFTQLSEKVSPQELLSLLNQVFSMFDQTVEKYGVEKIKTIGDAYMLAGGIPQPMDNHAGVVTKIGLEMQEQLSAFNLKNGLNLSIRIGIHTGPLVAGVIGTKKFCYDIWGDTVNIASRMESHGKSGYVHVSKETYELVKSQFRFEEPRCIEVKGKGLMETYLLKPLQ